MKKIYTFLSLILISITAAAQWNQDTIGRNPLTTIAWSQGNPMICRDDSRGYYTVWTDGGGGGITALKLQRVDSAGYQLWQTNGVLASPQNATWGYYPMKLISDDSGGVFICSHNGATASSELRVHRFDENGLPVWANNVKIHGGVNNYQVVSEQFCSDDKGGVIAGWGWSQQLGSKKTYVQRIDGSGNKLWGGSHVTISSATAGILNLVPDGKSGALIVFYRNSLLHVQHVDSSGNILWGSGVSLNRERYNSNDQPACSDGNGGIFVSFDTSFSSHPYNQLYMHHVDSAGTLLTPPEGFPVAVGCSPGYNNAMIPDGSGGVYAGFVTPLDSDYAVTTVIVKRINANGVTLWSDSALSFVNSQKESVELVSDGAGGVIVCWVDYRHNNEPSLRSQHYDANGNRLWFPWGYPVCALPNLSFENPWISYDMVTGIPGTAIVTWTDSRTAVFNSVDIYMARLDGQVATGIGESDAALVAELYPNPSSGNFSLSFSKTIKQGVIEVYSMNGTKVFSENILNEPGKHIQLDRPAAGLYLLSIYNGEYRSSAKLVIE